MTCLLAGLIGGLAVVSPVLAAAGEDDDFETAVLPVLKTYCLRCHNHQKQAGEFRLDTLDRDFSRQEAAERWSEVIFRMNAGEMPPAREPQPSVAELGQAVDWLSSRIKAGEAARMARRGPVAHYRLSREEYGHTIYDLLGVHYDVQLPGAFHDDPRWHGHERIGALLSLSPSHVDRYFRAAETVVERAFPDQPWKSEIVRKNADDGQWRQQGHAGPVRWLFWPGHNLPAFTARSPGLYRVRIQLSGLPSFRGRLPHLALWHQGLKRSVTGLDVRAAEDEPTIVEITGFLPEGVFHVMNESPGMFSDGHTLSNSWFTFRHTRTTRPQRPTGYQLFLDDGQPIYPLLLVDWVETEGPLQLPADEQKRAGLFPERAGDAGEIRQCLQRFAGRAWRRPVADAELQRYVNLVDQELAAGEPFRAAYRSAMAAVLTSKNFCYLAEGTPDAPRDRINDQELASRLSFFLWSSLPDEALETAARGGTLHEADTLRSQIQRMLTDPKIGRFTQSFPRQWLQLHRVGQFPADPELYPDYDKWLEESMVQESLHYFQRVFQENLPLREFLDSDWTMLNPRLALHYGMPPVPETGFQRVPLRPDDHRGGLLTQAAILSLTSDGTRHRPVHRGVWVSEAIFGRTPPPPPPNVEPLAPTPGDKPKATIRQQLEAHATHAICASCHQKIDPLGFAFDSYDAIGRWRTEEIVAGGQGANPPVNARGQLPDGREFAGTSEFRQLLAQDVDRFAEAFVEQLATYALRRVMTQDDAGQIRAIARAGRADQYRLQSLLTHLLLSDLFQKR